MIQTSASLVKYDNPVLVSRTDAAKGKVGGDAKKPPVGAPKKLPPVDDKGRPKTPSQTEDILNSILPPRYLFKSLKSLNQ
jgi:dynein light intermediate chain